MKLKATIGVHKEKGNTMSECIKLEDATNAIEDKIAEYIPVLYGRYCEMPLEIRMAIEHLPTVEVSEDCISRKWLFDKAKSEFDELGEDYDINLMLRDIKNAPSVALLQDGVVMERLDFVKKVIETHIDNAQSGIFFTRNFVGDRMVHLNRRFGIDIEICYEYEYFEIFGLTDHEQIIIESFYNVLKRGRRTND